MRYRLNQNWDGVRFSPSMVEQASEMAADLVVLERGRCGGTKQAITTVARQCRVSSAQIRKLVQPSRKPKDIGTQLWQRLLDAYAGYLRRELEDIETRLAAARALGRPLADLEIEAENLARRIRGKQQ